MPTAGLIVSATLLVAALFLLMSPRSRTAAAVCRKAFVEPWLVAGPSALLGITGLVNTADLEWFPSRPALSALAVGLLIVSTVVVGILVAVAMSRKAAAGRADAAGTPVDDLLR
ncbi:hypothetical protein [Actinoplanes sp. NPDC051494]|uniref:hypothetical protein n=1 Tax=Actinoplanes sp. NPDC051494 TaxID=3363907 RepID=UPI0037A09200